LCQPAEASAQADTRCSSVSAQASTASRLTSVTIAKRPSVEAERRKIEVIWVDPELKYFCLEGLDS
jgi:hypothetical protein